MSSIFRTKNCELRDNRHRSRCVRISGHSTMLEATNEGKLQHEDIIRVLLRERFQREVSQLQLRSITS